MVEKLDTLVADAPYKRGFYEPIPNPIFELGLGPPMAPALLLPIPVKPVPVAPKFVLIYD